MAAGVDRKGCCTSAAVVGCEGGAAGVVHRDVAGSTTESGDLADLSQLGGLSVEREAGDGSSLLAFVLIELVGREEGLAIRSEGEKGRAVRLDGEAGLSEVACGSVEGVGVDALARSRGLSSDQQQSLRIQSVCDGRPWMRHKGCRRRTLNKTSPRNLLHSYRPFKSHSFCNICIVMLNAA